MPEGDTAFRAARNLHRALAGAELTVGDLRVPRLAVTSLVGSRVEGVVSRGKHLLARIGPWTLHTHLGMDGNWRIEPAPPGGFTNAGLGDHRIRVVLGTAEHRCVGRLLPVVELWPTAEEEQHLGHLGPDLLGPDWNPEEALQRLRAAADTPIGVALLDQRIMAGLGNVYSNELCFIRGVLPTRPVAEVPDLPRTVALAHELITANRDRSNRVFTGDPRPGRGTWVYGRDRKHCRRCRTAIRRGALGSAGQERITFYCSHCQR